MESFVTSDDFDFKLIEENILKHIQDQYLSKFEQDFVFLILKGRRTSECAALLKIKQCEIVRKRKVLMRKLRAIYTYHFLYDPIYFLKYAANKLDDTKFRCLVLHIFDLAPLKIIAKKMGVMPSTAQRYLAFCRDELKKDCSDPYIVKYSNCFRDLPYLGIEKIRRTKQQEKEFGSIKIGNRLLKDWLED